MIVYTLVVDESTRTSFAILPPGVSDISMLSTLPDYVGMHLLDHLDMLYFCPKNSRWSLNVEKDLSHHFDVICGVA
jgi:hypothetical protein